MFLIMRHSSNFASPFGLQSVYYCVNSQKQLFFEQCKIRAPTLQILY